MRRVWHHNPFVYFVAPVGGGLIKIGSAVRVEERLRGLQAMSAVPVELLASAQGNYFSEYAVQAEFLPHRSHFEWFHPAPALVSLIVQIKKTGELPARFLPGGPIKNPLWHNARCRNREAAA